MTTTPPPIPGRLSTRAIATTMAVLALGAAIAVALWLLISPAPSHPSTFAPSVPRPAAASAQLCVPPPGVRFC